jgi:hypothetical protein
MRILQGLLAKIERIRDIDTTRLSSPSLCAPFSQNRISKEHICYGIAVSFIYASRRTDLNSTGYKSRLVQGLIRILTILYIIGRDSSPINEDTRKLEGFIIA